MESERKAAHDEKPVSGSPSSFTSSPAVTPPHSPRKIPPFLIPSPIPTRRNRTTSQSRMAAESPEHHGICKYFCRNKGHGFITPDDGGENIFVHISEFELQFLRTTFSFLRIEGEYVLKEGDRVRYRTVMLPPKHLKQQAVEVIITEMHGAHEKWWSGS